MRIVFLGAGEFGLPTLRALAGHHDVPLVISQPDRPAGRKRVMTPTAIAAWAQAQGIETIKPDKVNDEAHLERIRALEPDAMVIVAFGQYLKQALVAIPQHGAMNLHASLLPRWRGASPINSAVLAGDTETGNTIIRIAKKMDAGAMLGKQATPIDPLETAGELHDRLAAMGPDLVLQVLDELQNGRATETQQDDEAATLAPKLSREDGYVDFTESADAVRTRVHGLTPWPGVTAYWSADETGERKQLKICRVAPLPDQSHRGEPGRLLDLEGTIACGTGAVKLLEVQPPGKRVMPWADFANGHQVKPGTRFWRDSH
jgi:methionyl-tRNA formyltransferase